MAAVDSSAAGYLTGGAGPPYDTDLEDIFQGVIAGITGLPGNLVRPRYQKDPPNIPAFDVDWCAFGVTVEATLFNASKRFDETGAYVVEGTEVIRVNASFYGPHYQATERRWRDGLQVGQNRDALTVAKIALVEFAEPAIVPALMKEQWVKRADVRGTFHRWAVRQYPVLTFASANGTVTTDDGFSESFTVNPPP